MTNIDEMICDYFKEKDGVEVIKNEFGFAFYLVFPLERKLLITDMYIKKEYQKMGFGSKLLEEIEQIALKNECKFLVSYVGNHKNKEGSLIAQLKRGFKIQKIDDDKNIFLMKEL